MVTIHLKDGKEKQFESNVALSEAAKAISNSLGKEAVVAKVDGELTDLRDPIVDGTTVEFFTKKGSGRAFHTQTYCSACNGSSNPAFISRRKICNWPGY